MESLKVHRIAAPLRQQVVDKLRAAIADGRFRPGQRLVERELCELLGVSRTLVREALRQLETEQLIDVVPHHGPVVRTVDLKEAEEVYQMRSVLEPLAVKLCAQNADEPLKRRLRKSYELLRKVFARGDVAESLRAKTEFYSVILDGAANEVLRRHLEMMHVQVNQLRAVSLSQPGRAEDSMADVKGIVDSICANDPDGAWAAGVHHADRAAENALSVMRQSVVDDEKERMASSR